MKVGFVYDFDLTLTEEYQQFPVLRKFQTELKEKYGIESLTDYWDLCNLQGQELGIGSMSQFLLDCNSVFKGINNHSLEFEFGPKIELSPGVPEWFYRINEFAKGLGAEIEHHVISVGFTPLIRGALLDSPITSIKGGEFLENGDFLWRVKSVVSPFSKVERLKVICRGEDLYHDLEPDKYHLDYRHVIAFGDGFSDLDLFRYVKQRGGYSIGVFKRKDEEGCRKLIDLVGGRSTKNLFVNLVAPRDYSENSTLEEVCKGLLVRMIKTEEECNMDYWLISKYKNGSLRNPEVKKIVEEHFQNCDHCQFRYVTQFFSE